MDAMEARRSLANRGLLIGAYASCGYEGINCP